MHLKIKIPPVIQFAFCALAMWLLAKIPAPALQLPATKNWSVIPLIIGIAVGIAGLSAFRQAGTTADPIRIENASNIVRHGIYRHTRNPMYLGLALVLAAWALWLAHLLAWLGLPLFITAIQYLQIQPEEQILTQKFGEAYRTYCRNVRRWL